MSMKPLFTSLDFILVASSHFDSNTLILKHLSLFSILLIVSLLTHLHILVFLACCNAIHCVQVKDVRWDPELGGQSMELRLVEYFADEFNEQVGNGVDVRKSSKAMAKLKKQVKRTKEILSANTVAPISVESLYDDRDFR
jgi:hypothetical protein